MDNDPKKLNDIDDNLNNFFNVDDKEIDDLIKQAESDLKSEETQKSIKAVEEKKKTKKNKKKKSKKEENTVDKEYEEFMKWKEQKAQKEKNKQKKNSKDSEEESDEEEKEEEENSEDNNEEETFSVDDFPPKLINKINKKDLRIVLTSIEKCDLKYTEGLDLVNEGDYEFALDYFKNANSSYLALNKLVQSKTDVYPTEFRNIVSSKINEKIKLLKKEAQKCAKLKKENEKKNKVRNDFNSNNNQNQNITNYNYNINIQNKQAPKSIHDAEEDAMDQKIESEIMVKNPKVKFTDIIGMQEMKQTLYEIIVVPTIRPDLFTGIRKPQRGILLFGPPGTGKTMIAKAIASECNSTFFNISASSLTSKWVGESEKTVRSLFKVAYKKVPSIIFIDEIDSILSKRSGSENEATKRLKTEFLIQFDGLGSNTNARLLVIAATNRPMDLDEALLRRLPKRVYCGPLDENGRFEFIKKVINRVETNLSDEDIREIAKMTNDYSNSDLMEMCREAAYQPVRELSMEEILKINKFRPLVKEDLVKAVHKIRGTLSKKVRDELQKWNEQFGGI